jgi:hypothetical protein
MTADLRAAIDFAEANSLRTREHPPTGAAGLPPSPKVGRST